ncbi:MAG: hypothetical protein ACI4RT_03895 [Candidatus Spyradenecus sp.]
MAALALWPAIAGCLPSLGYLVGQNWLLPAWLLGGGVAAWAAWRLGRWRALLLCVLYATGTFFLTSVCFLGQSSDYMSYHLPQVFLLEAGWNPALQGSLEAVEALGIAPLDTFRPFHTICFPLFGAQWCAATDLATGALFGFNWLVALLFPGAGYLTLRTLHRCLPTLRPWQTWALTLLFVVLLTFPCDYQDRGPHAKTFLQALCIASNLQRPLYFPELAPTQAERPALVSKNTYHYNEDRPRPNYPRRFPERDGSYALTELYETRGKLPLNRNYALFRLVRLRDYDAPADFLFLYPKCSAYAQSIQPWQQPLSLAEVCALTRTLLRNFYRRWLEVKREA